MKKVKVNFKKQQSSSSYDFSNLLVLDLANNHQGSVKHGSKIIKETAKIIRNLKVRAGIKFQFRQLDTFIHKKHQKNSKESYVKRFKSTEMSLNDYKTLLDRVKKENIISICTPFDESSVDIAADMGFEILKIASCSAKDWPLLEKVSNSNLPIIISTGGLEVHEIDNIVSFFEHKGVDFAIMHCVSVYPSPNAILDLNQIDRLINRYPNITVGWSTHENPNNLMPISIAVAKGAKIFERHIGLETNKIKLNQYSSTPKQLERWMSAYKEAINICGSGDQKNITNIEKDSLDQLRRGVFAKRAIKKGMKIFLNDIYFAFPYQSGQLDSEKWKPGTIVKKNILADSPIKGVDIRPPKQSRNLPLKHAIHDVKALLNEAKIILGDEFKIEYSHHYGIKNFHKIGATIINCINREYAKKIIIQLPGQKHPKHYHKRKEETFQVLYGVLHSDLNGKNKILYPGDTLLVQPGVWHSFWSDAGCIFEEVSTTHFDDDSFYKDKKINNMKREDRKTFVNHWGRFEIPA